MPKGRRKQAQQSDQIEAKTYHHSEADSPLRPDGNSLVVMNSFLHYEGFGGGGG